MSPESHRRSSPAFAARLRWWSVRLLVAGAAAALAACGEPCDTHADCDTGEVCIFGDPGRCATACDDDTDCDGGTCNDCATASCPVCADCVGACE